MRWSSNFTPEFEKLNCKVLYDVDQLGKANVRVEVKIGEETVEIPWEEYLKNHVEEKRHEMMRRNVLLATRNFQNRMEAFRKEIIFETTPCASGTFPTGLSFKVISLPEMKACICTFSVTDDTVMTRN